MLPTLLRLFCRYGSRNPQSWFPSFLGTWSLISGAFPSCSRPHRHSGACAASSRSSCVGPSALSRFISLLFWVQPDVSPGNCWPFQGRQGQVVIRLPARVHLSAVTVQHISKEASPSGSVISAPRDVAVFGLDADGEEETLLGMFMYNVAKEPIQTFPLKALPRAFSYVKFLVKSNWGNPKYTCIYRVRVHGKMAKPESLS
ncbi:Sperm-associated antigen 4 protein-like [Columba livia]|nr:Sperm-associated antigen 4 protein-like [Columba livia]